MCDKPVPSIQGARCQMVPKRNLDEEARIQRVHDIMNGFTKTDSEEMDRLRSQFERA